MGAVTGGGPCPDCLRRTWLLTRLSGHLDVQRGQILELLELEDLELIAAVAGSQREAVGREWRSFTSSSADPAGGTRPRETRVSSYRDGYARTSALCRCDPRYPRRLHELPAPPAVLHVAGDLSRFLKMASEDPVALVGSRRASDYGLEVARSLGRGLAASGTAIVSGLARGIDAGAHRGALEVAGGTIAVLPGPVTRPYPPAQGALHARIIAAGAAVSELPSGTSVRRWSFLARNRLTAAISVATVVVEAATGSGSLTTATAARGLGRAVGAVPGRVTSAASAGSNELLATGAALIRDAQDVLDLVYGAGNRRAVRRDRSSLSEEQTHVLAHLGLEEGGPASLAAVGLPASRALAVLAELELEGWIRRGPGGRFDVVP